MHAKIRDYPHSLMNPIHLCTPFTDGLVAIDRTRTGFI